MPGSFIVGDGYRAVWRDGRNVRTHRLVWQEAHGPIPPGVQIHHKCYNRECSNLAHLADMTPRENTLDSPVAPAAVNARKLTCLAGHAYEGGNLYRWKDGSRHCRACQREASARYRTRKAAGL